MTDNNDKGLARPESARENPEATIKRLEEELTNAHAIKEKALNENQILRASIKALASLL